MLPKTGLELATTAFDVDLEDLEEFKLFAQAKLNLSRISVVQYTRSIKAPLKEIDIVTDRDIKVYIQKKKERSCTPDYAFNIISSFNAYFRDYEGLS